MDKIAQSQSIDDLFDSIEAALSNDESLDCARRRVAKLQRIIDENDANEHSDTNEAHVALVHHAIEIMTSNVSSPLTIVQIASACKTSPTMLKQTFRAVMGEPIYRWYRAHRIGRACMLLSDTDLPIAQVATAVGYSNPSKFAKAFRDEVGKTPREWRNS